MGAETTGEQLYRAAVTAQNAGRLDQAVAGYVRVLDADPDHLPARNNLAAALADMGRADEAAACYRAGLARHPASPELNANFANLLRAAGDLDGAADHYGHALAALPDAAEVRYARGVVLRALGRADDAWRELQAVATALPDDHRPRTALAALALDGHDLALAGSLIDEALALAAADADALNLKAVVHKEQGAFDAARTMFDAAIAADPTHAEARYNRGALRLLLGDMPAAWADYEWRWGAPDTHRPPGVPAAVPRWQGGDLAGRTILLSGEQGYGDTIQFIRYAPLLAARGARVVVRCRKSLRRLAVEVDGVGAATVIDGPAPEADAYVAMMSLPARFRTAADSIPLADGYLRRPSPPESDDLRVGVVWAGSPSHGNDANRSLSPAVLSPVFAVPGVRFFSLQMGAAAAALATLPAKTPIVDHTDGITDFADTADRLAGLDLLISVDTAIAHLAGALGRPVWVLLPAVPDWRWMCSGGSTPWYRSMTLFRQQNRGDWTAPIAQVAQALKARTRS